MNGLLFACATPAQSAALRNDFADYLRELGIEDTWVNQHERAGDDGIEVNFSLNTPTSDTDTLTLSRRALFEVRDELVHLPRGDGTLRAQLTVSRKEILLALLQHGRRTEFGAQGCSIEALRDHVGIRQNIVAWAERLNWGWPDGGPASWNRKYWKAGTPVSRSALARGLEDALVQPSKYEIGCYTATKLVIAHGVLDYFRRVKGDAARAALVERRMWANGDPLTAIEPARVWAFEPGFEAARLDDAGKLLDVQSGVAARNFVPGDWAYFLNTDPISYEKTGYEGSNAIYLGRNRFNDHYNDNNHAYTFEQKLDTVFQWRNGVFSHVRDMGRVTPLTARDLARLEQTPDAGGVLLPIRMVPFAFGFGTLPELEAPLASSH